MQLNFRKLWGLGPRPGPALGPGPGPSPGRAQGRAQPGPKAGSSTKSEVQLSRRETLHDDARKEKTARHRPRLGEIGRESGQKDEESTRNSKKALPGPKKHSGSVFRTFRFLEGLDIFQNFTGRRTDDSSGPFRPDVFVHLLLVSLFRRRRHRRRLTSACPPCRGLTGRCRRGRWALAGG